MSNYFNQLSLRNQLHQLGQCRLMDASEFEDGIKVLAKKKNYNCWLWSPRLKSRLKHA